MTTSRPIRVTFRIPGSWSHPGELLERLPEGYRLTADALFLPTGEEIEFTPLPPDEQFPDIFRGACRTPLNAEDAVAVDSYTVNVVLSGPGGSVPTAETMMQAAAAIVRAGGAGVFIDNSALAHAGHLWLQMTDADDPEALSFAFVSVITGRSQIWTAGMHLLGFPDVQMDHTCGQGDDVIEVLRYISSTERPVEDGHVIADENGPWFRLIAQPDEQSAPDTPMFNPHGRLQMKSVRRMAEEN